MTTLLWFKRDLRIHDHPALALAARDERVVRRPRRAKPDDAQLKLDL